MADLKKDNEKISREVGAMDGLTGSALSNVAGGNPGGNTVAMPVNLWKEMMKDAGYVVNEYFDESECGYYFRCYRKSDVMPFKESYYPYKDQNGNDFMDFEM